MGQEKKLHLPHKTTQPQTTYRWHTACKKNGRKIGTHTYSMCPYPVQPELAATVCRLCCQPIFLQYLLFFLL